MQAITIVAPGGPDVLKLGTVPDPIPGPEQILVRVRATALNRADTLQRQGQYPPPPGESDVLGLELAGEVEAVGSAVTTIAVGERVFGLVGGGGYAEKAVIDARMAMPIPEGWSFAQAAAVPEVYFTAQETIFTLAGLQRGRNHPDPCRSERSGDGRYSDGPRDRGNRAGHRRLGRKDPTLCGPRSDRRL